MGHHAWLSSQSWAKLCSHQLLWNLHELREVASPSSLTEEILPEFSQEGRKERGNSEISMPEVSRWGERKASGHPVSTVSGSGFPFTTSSALGWSCA